MKRGIVLIFTLAMIAILSVLVLEFNYTSKVDLDVAANFRDLLAAEWLAKSAVEVAIFLLTKRDDNLGVDSLNEEWAKSLPSLAIENGEINLQIIDEERKINVNKIKDRYKVNSQLKRLLSLIGENYSVLEKIREEGPYITLTQLANKSDLTNYLTIFGDGKININTAPWQVIKSLSPLIDDKLVQNIVEFRKAKPFSAVTQLSPAYKYEKPIGITKEIYNDIKDLITVRSKNFLIKVNVRVGNVVRKIEAVIHRKGRSYTFLYYRISEL